MFFALLLHAISVFGAIVSFISIMLAAWMTVKCKCNELPCKCVLCLVDDSDTADRIMYEHITHIKQILYAFNQALNSINKSFVSLETNVNTKNNHQQLLLFIALALHERSQEKQTLPRNAQRWRKKLLTNYVSPSLHVLDYIGREFSLSYTFLERFLVAVEHCWFLTKKRIVCIAKRLMFQLSRHVINRRCLDTLRYLYHKFISIRNLILVSIYLSVQFSFRSDRLIASLVLLCFFLVFIHS